MSCCSNVVILSTVLFTRTFYMEDNTMKLVQNNVCVKNMTEIIVRYIQQ